MIFHQKLKYDIIAMINMDIEMLNHAMVAFDKHDLDDIIYVDDHESNLDYYNKKQNKDIFNVLLIKLKNQLLSILHTLISYLT